VAFVKIDDDPSYDRAWWLQLARLLQCPLQVVLALESAATDQLSDIPGRLGLHWEFGFLLARQLLGSDSSSG
jgi:hypothetical protein